MIDLTIKRIIHNGDCAILVEFNKSKQRLVGIHALCDELLRNPLDFLINVIPSTNSITLVFATPVHSITVLFEDISCLCKQLKTNQSAIKKHEIPVCYHPKVATDIEFVCKHLNINLAQLISWHTKPIYRVAMLGFLPGFAYLTGNHKQLNIPRKSTPAMQVAAGSVAIAGKQTGLYALSSPGGWHVIGRTDFTLMKWVEEGEPSQINPLDQIQFKAVSIDVFQHQMSDS